MLLAHCAKAWRLLADLIHIKSCTSACLLLCEFCCVRARAPRHEDDDYNDNNNNTMLCECVLLIDDDVRVAPSGLRRTNARLRCVDAATMCTMFMACIRATRTQGIKVFSFLVRGVSRKL